MAASDIFIERFGRAPLASGRAPGRVNLIGEHVDYNGGMVLPMTIAPFADVALAPNEQAVHQISSPAFGAPVTRAPGLPKQDDWADYALGALNKATELGLLDGPVCIAIESTVPGGAGLSSSAALITAILRAACEFAGTSIDAETLAHAARAVENDYIGVPCGIMDQMAVGLCRAGEALALNTVDCSHETVAIPTDWSFAVFHSGVHRKLSDGRYEARFRECAEAKRLLGVEHLCLHSETDIRAAANLPGALAARTRHVVGDHQRTLAAASAMRASNADLFAELLNESHRSYSQDFEASTPEIDTLVASAVSEGALAARLTGGGFGGCIVTFLHASEADTVSDRILSANPQTRRVT